MTSLRTAVAAAVMLVLTLAAASASAQTTVTSADIQRLQERLDDARADLSRMGSASSRLDTELNELADEVAALRVQLRKEGSVPRSEYTSLRDRIDRIAAEARGEAPPPSGTSGVGGTTIGRDRDTGRRYEIPAGQELDVRLERELSSETAQVEDRVVATTVVDLSVDGRVLIPAGATVRGVVTSVESAGRLDRKGRISLLFDEITIDNRTYPMRATVVQALESGGYKEDAGKIGAGAGVGAIIGGILGGVKGALAGILIGGGGVVAATEGKDVVLPSGSILRIRLDSPPDLRR